MNFLTKIKNYFFNVPKKITEIYEISESSNIFENDERVVDFFINSKNAFKRELVLSNKSVKLRHIDAAIVDVNPKVRAAAINNSNANLRHFNKVLNDPDNYVRELAEKQLIRLSK